MSDSKYSLETTSGTTTSWLPLTTVYPIVNGCDQLFRQIPEGLLGYDPNYGKTIDPRYSCAPPQATAWWEQLNGNTQTYNGNIEIGPVTCPQSWRVVQTSIKDSVSTYSMCCPPGYQRGDGQLGNPVVNIVGGYPTVDYAFGCMSTVTPGQTLTYRNASGTTTTSMSVTSFVLAIALVGMNKPTAVSSNSSALASATASPILPTATSGAAISESSSSGLSNGAKAGIGIGVTIGVIGIIALVIAMFILRRSRKRNDPAMTNEKQEQLWQHNGSGGRVFPSSGLSPYDRVQFQPKSELHSTTWSETNARGVPIEIDGRHRLQEMEVPDRKY